VLQGGSTSESNAPAGHSGQSEGRDLGGEAAGAREAGYDTSQAVEEGIGVRAPTEPDSTLKLAAERAIERAETAEKQAVRKNVMQGTLSINSSWVLHIL